MPLAVRGHRLLAVHREPDATTMSALEVGPWFSGLGCLERVRFPQMGEAVGRERRDHGASMTNLEIEAAYKALTPAGRRWAVRNQTTSTLARVALDGAETGWPVAL